jgi:hypothetical protein
VHAGYTITKGGFPELICRLIEDCMLLTVANVPVVVAASIHCISGTNSHDANDDDDDQRWSALKVHTQTTRLSGSTTCWSTSFRPNRGSVSVCITMEITSTTPDATRETFPVYLELANE